MVPVDHLLLLYRPESQAESCLPSRPARHRVLEEVSCLHWGLPVIWRVVQQLLFHRLARRPVRSDMLEQLDACLELLEDVQFYLLGGWNSIPGPARDPVLLTYYGPRRATVSLGAAVPSITTYLGRYLCMWCARINLMSLRCLSLRSAISDFASSRPALPPLPRYSTVGTYVVLINMFRSKRPVPIVAVHCPDATSTFL